MDSIQRVEIEEWKRDFFSSGKSSDFQESHSGISNLSGVNQFKQRKTQELQLLELMNPNAFDRIPMIYEQRDSKYIQENWKESRNHLTKDYIKKAKQASRRMKTKTY
ncbi:hypothetical protein HWI79_1903 [Cryptosporidium felis]|nr:hypothetical protein HWI79_1903 [Cryptosporidium felis]